MGAVVLMGFVILAVVVEVIAAQYSESPVPSWTVGVFPLTWSQPVRVLWWEAVTVAAFGSRLLMKRAGVPVRGWVTVVAVGPFMIFTIGVAWGLDWATWH